MTIKLEEHPEFKKNKNFYQAAKDLYQGDQDTLKQSKYLLLHELEKYKQGTKIRNVREERSAYTNFIEPIVSMWVSLFFKKKPTLDEATSDMLGNLINDIDGEGTNLFAFIQKKLLPSSLIYGFPILE
jgi:dihydropteroate synthase